MPWKGLSIGHPFCSPDWMGAWARHFCAYGSLYVLAVFDRDSVVGIAPLHSHKSRIGGHRLAFLGTGKACSEHLKLLVDPLHLEPVTDALAQWLLEAANGVYGDDNCWQRLDLESVGPDDLATLLLCKKLSDSGAEWVTEKSSDCWKIDLTGSKEQWISGLNKSVRRKLRLLESRAVQNGRAVYKIAKTNEERSAMFDKLVCLHTARRHQLKESGCFDHPGFHDFLYQVICSPDANDFVRVSQVEVDGTVVAAGICLENNDGLFVYQSGISLPRESNPDLAAANPGWLLNLFHIDYCWKRNLKFIDYLRGDEKYKTHLGAVPMRVNRYMVVPPNASSLIRQRIWSLTRTAKGIGKEVKQILPRF
jgi:CelD/BcsL family acetyltransferase involved in cellulose biosynthesis